MFRRVGLERGLAPGAARHVFLRPRRAAGMAEKVAELRGLPSTAERRQERRGEGGGGAGPTAPVPLDSERGLPLLRVKRHYHALGDLVVGAELIGAVESIISENLATGKIRSYGLARPRPRAPPAGGRRPCLRGMRRTDRPCQGDTAVA